MPRIEVLDGRELGRELCRELGPSDVQGHTWRLAVRCQVFAIPSGDAATGCKGGVFNVPRARSRGAETPYSSQTLITGAYPQL
jgi:hypothetical protein